MSADDSFTIRQNSCQIFRVERNRKRRVVEAIATALPARVAEPRRLAGFGRSASRDGTGSRTRRLYRGGARRHRGEKGPGGRSSIWRSTPGTPCPVGG